MGDLRETFWRTIGGDESSSLKWDRIFTVIGGIAAVVAAIFSALSYFR